LNRGRYRYRLLPHILALGHGGSRGPCKSERSLFYNKGTVGSPPATAARVESCDGVGSRATNRADRLTWLEILSPNRTPRRPIRSINATNGKRLSRTFFDLGGRSKPCVTSLTEHFFAPVYGPAMLSTRGRVVNRKEMGMSKFDELSDRELAWASGGSLVIGIPAGAMVAKGPGLLVWATATDHGYVVDTSGKVPPRKP